MFRLINKYLEVKYHFNFHGDDTGGFKSMFISKFTIFLICDIL